MLSKEIKLQAFNAITSDPSFLGKYQPHDGIIAFLNRIWNLRELPSSDDRFKNAYEDAIQHLINNDDWSIENVFIDRFKLIEDDEKYFIAFIETTVSPTVRLSKEEILQYVQKINQIIQFTGFKLIAADYFEGLPVYRYGDSTKLIDLPLDIAANNIPIYLDGGSQVYEYPCVILSYDNWDDYGNKTTFNLYYYKNRSIFSMLGKVKIMQSESQRTWDTLQPKFTSLSSDYCSLGQSKEYYVNLKSFLGSNYYSFLLAMRDVAIFPKIHEQFEDNIIFIKSLIRDNSKERLARTVRFEIEGIRYEEYYKFNYTYQPPYSENSINLSFDFEYYKDFQHRMYAIIGKNGTGKTRILSSLAKDLSERNPTNFSPHKPIYGKIFTVSYSFFDLFEIPDSNASFNYVYCGLKKSKNEWKSDEDLVEGFIKSVSLVKAKHLENNWYGILKSFLVEEVLNISFEAIDEFGVITYKFNENKFPEMRKVLSSGQSITLFMITEILARIRLDSLILFDEPETHLHPNAINALLNTLFALVKDFQSFCIIATHSPLVIQEIPARNIFVIEREESSIDVKKLERETFGENLTVITQEIFGNRDVPKHFIVLLKELIEKGKSYEDIINILESGGLPINSNIRLYLKALMPQS